MIISTECHRTKPHFRSQIKPSDYLEYTGVHPAEPGFLLLNNPEKNGLSVISGNGFIADRGFENSS